MTKHTAAPWHQGGYEIQDDKGALICNLSGWRGEQQTLANARLIAAAPELLNAFKGIVAFCDEDMQHRVQTSREYDIKTLAQAAIAKAEGEQA